MDLHKIYEYALAREREGRDFFRRHAERMPHAAAAGAFRALAAEEEQHIAYIQGLLRALDGEAPAVEPPAALDGEGLFAERAGRELLEQTVVESMIPDVAVLRTAYLIERDFVEFYQRMAERTEGEASAALQRLADWERSHAELFERLHDEVFEQYAGMPWGG
jgi:rubrerythrin